MQENSEVMAGKNGFAISKTAERLRAAPDGNDYCLFDRRTWKFIRQTSNEPYCSRRFAHKSTHFTVMAAGAHTLRHVFEKGRGTENSVENRERLF